MEAKSLDVEIQMSVGKIYRRRGREEAEPRLRRVLEMDPACFEAYLELGYRYYYRHEYERAIQEFNNAARISPGDKRTYIIIAEALFAIGREEEGISACDTAIRLDPDFLDALLAVGNVYLKQKNFRKALEYYRRALTVDAGSVSAAIGNIWARYSPEGIDSVIEKLREAVKQKPESAELHHSLGRALGQSGNIEDAISELRASASLDPRNAAVRNDLGSAYSQQGKRDEAVREWKEALKVQPAQFEAHLNLANAFAKSGYIEDALQQCLEALKIDPNFPNVHSLMASYHLQKKEYARAEEALQVALARNPGDHVARWNLAECYRAQGKEDLAAREREIIEKPYNEALRELQGRPGTPDPSFHDSTMKWANTQERHSDALPPKSYPEFLLLYSRICYTLERYEQSMQLCREVLALEPENKMAHLFLGNTCNKLGQQDEAVQSYRTALSIDPALSTARFNLAGILLGRGYVDEAQTEYKKILGSDPDFLPAYSNLAEIYVEKESYDEAAKAWREILRLEPLHEVARKNLSIYEARQVYREVSESFRQAHDCIQQTIEGLNRVWGDVPLIFLEIDKVLRQINHSHGASTDMLEIQADLLLVHKALTGLDGIRAAMAGMLPDFVAEEMAALAQALHALRDSLGKLQESLRSFSM